MLLHECILQTIVKKMHDDDYICHVCPAARSGSTVKEFAMMVSVLGKQPRSSLSTNSESQDITLVDQSSGLCMLWIWGLHVVRHNRHIPSCSVAA